jgi:hypothetical protein
VSYSIYIGQGHGKAKMVNGVLDVSKMKVPEIIREDAPDIPNDLFTAKGNGRHPGYSQWHGFTEEAGLEDMFYHPVDGLLRPHPGTRLLTPSHRDSIKEARKRWEETHPNAIPGFWEDYEPTEEEKDYCAILARLIWLDYWVSWTVENCEFPCMQNS